MDSQISKNSQWQFKAFIATAAFCLLGCAAWSQTTATVSVSTTSTMATIGPEAYGVDTSVYDNYLTASGVAALVQSAGINVLRYPGGSYADIFNFISGTDQTLNDGGYLAANATFNDWMPDLVTPAGVKAMITTNYGSNTANSGGAPPSEAAAWVQYANVTNNYDIVYWEIGNEIYGNGYYSTSLDWEYDLHYSESSASARVGQSALSPTAYGANAAAFIVAMKAVDPNIKCGVFASDASTYPNWDQDVFTAISAGLKGTGYTLDFVIEHYYPSGSDAQYLAAQTAIPSQVSQLRSDIANYYTVGNGSSMQIAITESGAGTVGGVFPFLWTVDDYLTWFENGAINVEYQELHNGFLSNASPGVPEGPWYGASFSSTIARPGDTMVTASSSNSLMRAHAVKRTDGQTGVILLNDDPSNNTTVTVNISGATLASTGTQYNFGNANFSSGAATANTGISSSSISGVGSSFTVTVPAYSAMGILIPASSGGTGSFTLKPSASTLSIAQGKTGTDTITVTDVSPFSGSVTLAASGLPTGVTAAFGTNPATSTSVLTLTVASTATAATSTITISGTSGSLSATTTIALTVTSTSTGSFSLKASAATLSIAQGASGTDTITITDVSPFSGSVTLAASGLPTGVTAAFGTNPATSTSVLTLTVASTATAAASTITITGTSGSLSATTTIALTVTSSGGSGTKCTVDYTIQPQNSSDFGAQITILNTGTTAWTSWTLTWAFANGQTVSSLWNGNETQSGANVTVTNMSYNGSVAAGGTVSGVGFNGTWNGTTNAIPTAFSINGTACTVN